MLKENLINDTQKLVENIISFILKNKSTIQNLPPTLYSGKAGFAIFLAEYNNIFYHEVVLDFYYEIVQDMLENKIINYPSLSNGIAGTFYAYQYLINKNYVNGETAFLSNIDNILIGEFDSYIEQKNFDLLHGALGIGVYFLSRFKQTGDPTYLLKISKDLIQISNVKDSYRYWISYRKFNLKYDCIDLGFAHGVPAILTFLLKVYTTVDKDVELKSSIIQGCNLLIHLLDKYYFGKRKWPSAVNEDDFTKLGEWQIKLSWCYSELSIVWLLWNAGDILKIDEYKETSKKVLACFVDLNIRYNYPYDACFCHGTSGISHLLNKIYESTLITDIGQSSIDWMNRSLKLYDKSGVSGLKFNDYDEKNDTFYKRMDFGILEGLAGIGLSTLNHIDRYKVKGWDEHLLIL